MLTIKTALRLGGAVAATALLAACSSTNTNSAGASSNTTTAGTTSTASATGATNTTSTTGTAVTGTTVTNPATGGATGGATGTAGGASTGAAGVPRCHTPDLTGSFTAVAGSEGAGNVTYNIELTNASSHTCTIYGHPGMQLLGAREPLPTHVTWSSVVPNSVITLAPGHSASASDRFSPDVPGPGDSTSGACQPVSRFTQITPPDETAHIVVAVSPPTSVCEQGGMSVSAFVAGSRGPGE